MFGRKKRTVKEEVAKELSDRLGVSEEEALKTLNEIQSKTAIFNSKFIDLLATNEKFINALCKNEKLIDALAKKLDFNLTRRLILATGVLGALTLGTGTAGAKLVLTDKFIELDGQKFYPAPVGAYDVIVSKDDTYVWAEDRFGRKIAEGVSGEDDAKIIQQAIDYTPDNSKIVLEGEFSINNYILVKNRKGLEISGGIINVTELIPAYKIYVIHRDVFGFADCQDIIVDNIVFNCNGYGGAIRFEPTEYYPPGEEPLAKNITIKNVVIKGGGKAGADEYISSIYIRNVKGIKIINCDISSPYSGEGAYIARHPNYEVIVTNNIFRESWLNGLYLGECNNDTIVAHNLFFRCGQRSSEDEYTDPGVDRNGIEVTASPTQGYSNRLIISDNIFIRCAGCGINCSAFGALIQNNIIIKCGGQAIGCAKDNITITNNYIRDNVGMGIAFHDKFITVTNNTIINCTLCAINVRFAKYCIVANNILYENNLSEDPFYGEIRFESKDDLRTEYILICNNIIKAIDKNNLSGIKIDAPYMSHIIIKNNYIYGSPPILKIVEVDNYYVENNVGYTTENKGIAYITGDGTTQTFTVDITHGLVSDKLTARITLDRDGTVDKVYLVDKDGDGFKETIRVQVTFATAPADGEQVPIYWYAEVVQ